MIAKFGRGRISRMTTLVLSSAVYTLKIEKDGYRLDFWVMQRGLFE